MAKHAKSGTKENPYRARKGKNGKVKSGRSRAIANRHKHKQHVYYQNKDKSVHAIDTKKCKDKIKKTCTKQVIKASYSKKNGKFFRVRGDGSKGGLPASKLTKNRNGKVVSKAKSAIGKKNEWIQATMRARKELGVKGFQPLKKSSELYKLAKKYHQRA